MDTAQLQSIRNQEAWARRRPAWTRNETARWLNERSETLLAYLRRKEPSSAPSHSKRMGWWVQTNRKPLFEHAHKKLFGCASPDQRERLGLLEVLR